MTRRPRSFTTDEAAAYEGLKRGELDALAGLLAQERGTLHPLIQRELAALISGSSKQTSWRLRVDRHPALGTARPEQRRLKRARDLQIAMHFERELIANGGRRPEAIDAVCEAFEVGATTVTNALRRGRGGPRAFLRFLRAHKVPR